MPAILNRVSLPKYFWLGLGLVLLIHGFFWIKLRHIHLSDPDTFIYLALARETATHGPLLKLPQAEDLGWGKSFGDRYLIFNLLNGLFFKMAGEVGVDVSLYLMSLSVLVVLYIGLSRFLFSPWAALIAGSAFLNSNFATRIFLYRPHVWAMACFSGLVVSLLYRSPPAALLFAAFFGWGYPLVLMPLAVLFFAYGIFVFQRKDSQMRKVCVWGTLGLLGSLLIHPSFPKNVEWASRVNFIALNEIHLVASEMPIESVPERADIFFERYAFFILIIFGGFLFESYQTRSWRSHQERQDFFLLGLLSSFLWIVSAFQPRGTEYAIPCTLLFLGICLYRLEGLFSTKRILVGFGCLAILGNWFSLVNFYGKGAKFNLNPEVPLASMDAIPAEANGKKVFNCEWETGAFLLYRRPDVRFVDLWEPALLAKISPSLFKERSLLKTGKLLPFPVIHDSFKADYVVCLNPYLVNRLDKDPFFTRIYPPPGDSLSRNKLGQSAVYKVEPTVKEKFIWEYNITPVPHKRSSETRTVLTTKSPFVNLIPFNENSTQGSDGCFILRPTEVEIQRLVGSHWLTIGGGPEIEVWWNEIPLYAGRDPDGELDYLRAWVPLPRQLQAKDRLRFRVCSKLSDSYHGAAFSLWKKNELDKFCAARNLPGPAPAKAKWAYSSDPVESCLGTLAQKNY